jgi:hypothetical protein
MPFFGAVFVCITAVCAVGMSRVGSVLVQQATTQNIADSAALAGASTFDESVTRSLVESQHGRLDCFSIEDLVVRVCVSIGNSRATATAAAGPVDMPPVSRDH